MSVSANTMVPVNNKSSCINIVDQKTRRSNVATNSLRTFAVHRNVFGCCDVVATVKPLRIDNLVWLTKSATKKLNVPSFDNF